MSNLGPSIRKSTWVCISSASCNCSLWFYCLEGKHHWAFELFARQKNRMHKKTLKTEYCLESLCQCPRHLYPCPRHLCPCPRHLCPCSRHLIQCPRHLCPYPRHLCPCPTHTLVSLPKTLVLDSCILAQDTWVPTKTLVSLLNTLDSLPKTHVSLS